MPHKSTTYATLHRFTKIQIYSDCVYRTTAQKRQINGYRYIRYSDCVYRTMAQKRLINGYRYIRYSYCVYVLWPRNVKSMGIDILDIAIVYTVLWRRNAKSMDTDIAIVNTVLWPRNLKSMRSFSQLPMNVPNWQENRWSWRVNRNSSLNSNFEGYMLVS